MMGGEFVSSFGDFDVAKDYRIVDRVVKACVCWTRNAILALERVELVGFLRDPLRVAVTFRGQVQGKAGSLFR
jgi:hypothetical protein